TARRSARSQRQRPVSCRRPAHRGRRADALTWVCDVERPQPGIERMGRARAAFRYSRQGQFYRRARSTAWSRYRRARRVAAAFRATRGANEDMTVQGSSTSLRCELEDRGTGPTWEFTAFGLPLPAVFAGDLPSAPGAVNRDSEGRPTALYTAPTTWLV